MTFVILVSALIMAALYGLLFVAVPIDIWIEKHIDANSSIYPNEPIRSSEVNDWEDIRNNV